MKWKKNLRKAALRGLFLIAFYFGLLLINGWYHDWQPEEKTRLLTPKWVEEHLVPDSVLSFVTWNIGYAGLGEESDFFYDDSGMWYSGSSMIHAPKELVDKNLFGIYTTLKHTKADFFLLQEVDKYADRSYKNNQVSDLAKALPDFTYTMALNYQCGRVPIPLLEPWHPYGMVTSGLTTFSRYRFNYATRYQLPGKYPMPDRMFQLDRCVALHRYDLKNGSGKQLVVMNLHNAAYDPGDKIKAIQLPFLRDLAISEYRKGNYVVLGGDWNQCPPFFRFDNFMPDNTQGYQQGNVPADMFPEDWRYAFDPTVPTNRKCRDPYMAGKTFVTLIDYFLVSPNVQIRSVKCLDQKFRHSDHQPVWMEVALR